MTHLVHEKVCIEGIIFAGFHGLKGKKLFDFVSLPIVLFDASYIMRDELYHHYTSLSNLIKWFFFFFFLESI